MDNILDNVLFNAFGNASENIFVYVCDMKKDISRWSKNTVDYFALEEEYIHKAGEKWLQRIHPNDRNEYIKDIENIFSGKTQNHNCQYRAQNKYGDYVWLECKGSVITDENGVPSIFAGLMTRLDNQLKYDNLTHLKTAHELQNKNFNVNSGILIHIGVQRFKVINSEHGVLYGNMVLVTLANIISNTIPSDCIPYRLQGDEFIIFAENKTTEFGLQLFNKINEQCSALTLAKDGIAAFSIISGIVKYPQDGTDFSTLINNAEHCAEHLKEASTDQVTIFTEKINAAHNRKSKIAQALTESIRNNFNGFELFFQPIVNNDNSTVVSCEALLRWNSHSDEIGNCYPGEFIPILENNGSIVQVGYFVMKEAIRMASIWQKKCKKFKVSFNVSYIQFEDSKFVPTLIKTAEEYKVDTSLIVIELTESVFASDTIMIQNTFKTLKKHGFMIALDDFGTGNSSFMLLHNYNVDIIKLDQTFIRGLNQSGSEVDYAIVESIAFLCNKINYLTVAEGVEDKYLWMRIKDFGFTGLQGYLFSKPLCVKEFEAFLRKYDMYYDTNK